MWGKVDHHFLSACISKLILNLRCMPVCGNTVSFDALVYLTVEIRNLGSSSCSGGSGLGINDNGVRINEAFL